MMQNPEKLKPCPFCGSKPNYIFRDVEEPQHGIGCSNLDCIIYLPPNDEIDILPNYTWCYVKKSCMVKAWNTRLKDT